MYGIESIKRVDSMTFKEFHFSEVRITKLANKIKNEYALFDDANFIKRSLDETKNQTLAGSMEYIGNMLFDFMPGEINHDVLILSKALKKVSKGGFLHGSVLHYIALLGIKSNNIELATRALFELTNIFTSEFAVRPLIEYDSSSVIALAMEFTKSPDEEQRRLASEGLRPFLPWGKRVTVNYKDATKPLNNLFFDHSRYVTRSVANHLNDISKINLDFVIATLSKWRKTQKQEDKEMSFIEKQSLRTAIKKGDKRALEYLGFGDYPQLENIRLTLQKHLLNVGEELCFTLTFKAKKSMGLIVDLIITYPSHTKKLSSKVYKWKTMKIEEGKQYRLEGKRSFKDLSTRIMKEGTHGIEIQVNGIILANEKFMLNRKRSTNN
jgi:3-methyladenine DNA glycosylase AlkC